MILQKVYIFMFCIESIFYVLLRVYVFMFCIESMFYVLHRVYVLFFAKGLWDELKKIAIMGMQMQQPPPAFASGSAHFGSEIPRMQGSYLRMNMKEVNEVEEMEEV